MGAAITAITGLALAAGLGPGALPPGEPLFQRLGIEQGLPSSAVNAIAQDRDGYLWIATSDGLARFDGLGFELWRAGAGEPPLPGNEVQALAATAEGFLWLAFEDRGIARLDPAARRLRHFPPGRGGAPANDVWAILEDREGAVWLGTWQEGLIRFHPERGRLAEHRHRPGDPESLPSDVVIQLARGRGGELLVATAEGFARLRDPGRGRFEVLRHGPEPGQGLAAPMVIGVHEDADGSLWIGTSAGVDLLRGGRLLRQGDPGHPLAALPPLRAQGFLRSGDGTLWLGTQDGVARLGPEGLAWHRGEEERRFALPRAGVVQLLEDHEGGLWFATRGGGLARLRPGWRNFAVFRHRAGDPASLPAAAVHAVVEDASGALWALAARGGLWRLDRESGRGERVLPEGWPDLPQLSLAADPAGGLWIGFHHGLARLDPATGRLELARLGEPGGLPRGAYSLLLASAPGEVWAAAYGIGLFRIGPGFALREEVRPGGPQGLPGADFEQLARGPEGGLWVAGAHGLVRLAEPGRGLEAHQVFAGERVFAFDFAADGRLWLALEDRIVRLGAEGEKAFGDATGYEAVRAGSLFVGEDGRVWVATPRGLLALDPRDGRFTRYGLGDGLPTLELSARPGFRAQDGSLWLPTQDGLVGFRPGALRRPEVPPPLRLVELSVQRGGRRVALDPGGAVLQAEDRELKVGVRALSYADAAANRYRFRLAGLDQDWIETVGRGEQLYPRLPPGRWRLEVEAVTPYGVRSAERLAIPLRVLPPWWRSPLALLLYGFAALLLLALAHLGWRRRLRRAHALALERQRRELAERASQAKSDFLAMVSHEIRTPLTGVLGMAELLVRQPLGAEGRRFAEAIRHGGELLLRLIEDLLVWSRLEAGRLEVERRPVELAALIANVLAIERPLAARKGLELRAELEPGLPPFILGDGLRIEQILLNLVHNAVKFTERGEVALRAERSGERLAIRVRDTGPGIAPETRERLFRRFERGLAPPTAPGYGLGLAIARELAECMGGEIVLDTEPGRGSEFSLLLPLMPAGATLAPAPVVPAASRVLLVEDDPVVRQTLLAMLAELGIEAVGAEHALAALAESERAAFDAALIDLDLPGVDGFECARLLKARAEREGTPAPRLVAITARRVGDEEGRCRAEGLEGPLRKPLGLAQLEQLFGRARR